MRGELGGELWGERGELGGDNRWKRGERERGERREEIYDERGERRFTNICRLRPVAFSHFVSGADVYPSQYLRV